MNYKKAQGLPMNTIVIAAIVLVVMVVLILIFTGNIGNWRQDVEDTETMAKARAECIARGGTVKKACTEVRADTKGNYIGDEDLEIEGLGENLYCCKPYK